MAAKRPRRTGAANQDEQKPAQPPDTRVPKTAKPGRADKVARRPLSPLPRALLNEAANVFKLLSDESRLRLLIDLAQGGELNVTAICQRLDQGQPAVSHHLALLRVSGAIEPRRAGKNIYYRVRSELFNDLLIRLISVLGTMPKRVSFHDFTLTRRGR
jgi:ArsR family transcriptional regulator, arsenate/arsenite/antimonite-responsive transcriptional repressor